MSDKSPSPGDGLKAQGLRFLIGGGANTFLSYCIYWLLLKWLPYSAAFTISYVLTIFTGFAINSYFVFRRNWSWPRFAAYPLIHVVNYLSGLAVVTAWVRLFGLPEPLAPIAATVFTLPLNFVMTRLLIHRRS